MPVNKKRTYKRSFRKKIHFQIEPWVASVYAIAAVVMVPWTIYISYSLPRRHLVQNWDTAWVGYDIGIMLMLLLTGFLAAIRSRWVIISVTVMSSLLLADAWFDIQTARSGRDLIESILLAIFVEIPFSILGYFIAFRTINRNIE